MAKLRAWPKHGSARLGDFRVFALRGDDVESPRTGARHRVYVLEAPPWVNVVPVTPEGDVVLVEQYRHGIETVTLEIPGGMVDAPESPLDAAARELLEETGCRAGALVPLGTSHPNPAIQDNVLHTFLATDVRRVGEPALEAGEDIRVVAWPRRELPRLVREGRISHALVLAALHLLALHDGG